MGLYQVIILGHNKIHDSSLLHKISFLFISDLPENWKEIDELAQAGGKAIRDATGTKYTIGSSTNVLYAAAGGSDDYALGAMKIPFSITMELPRGGVAGFDPPPSSIEKLVTETWIGIHAMGRHIAKYYSARESKSNNNEMNFARS